MQKKIQQVITVYVTTGRFETLYINNDYNCYVSVYNNIKIFFCRKKQSFTAERKRARSLLLSPAAETVFELDKPLSSLVYHANDRSTSVRKKK